MFYIYKIDFCRLAGWINWRQVKLASQTFVLAFSIFELQEANFVKPEKCGEIGLQIAHSPEIKKYNKAQPFCCVCKFAGSIFSC